MDRSMDSIGSCSLDVDAESSDISDTSGSLNFPTPISIKDITREFTNNIRERCSVQTVKNTTAYVDPVTGQVCIALTQAPTNTGNTNRSGIAESNHNQPKTNISKKTPTLLSPQTPDDSYDKKPSYLNLACCVNGYSNITTYDSKIRQDINKSREVSPIRPSSSSLQYCKKSNSLAPPVLLTMPNLNLPSPHQLASTTGGVYVTSTTIGSRYSISDNNGHSQNGVDVHNTSNEGGGGGGGVNGSSARSFIQQRVERLYGPGALAQGFYSPKKIKASSACLNKTDIKESNGTGNGATELARKFQELSPSKDYNQFRKKLSNGKSPISPNNFAAKDDVAKADNSNVDLPCLRHLSQEFRDKLPVISPKRNFSRLSPGREIIQPQTHATPTTTATNGTDNTQPTTVTHNSDKHFEEKLQHNNHQQQQHHLQTTATSSMLIPSSTIAGRDELDRKITVPVAVDDISVLDKLVPAIDEPKVVLPTIDPQKSISNMAAAGNETMQASSATNGLAKSGVRDAHFFLRQLKDEQNRLLIMAAEAEKYLDALASNPDITEDTLGLLRSASGKARLLVSQKMKQFEGLCHNNLNSSPEDQFPTTVDDLQGFWDMVYLQVDHVDSIFADIEKLKKNDWKPLEAKPPAVSIAKTPRGSKTPLYSKSKPSTPMTNGAAATATPTAAALKREAQRKKLQEMKRRNREAMAAASASANSTIIEPSSTNETEGVKSETSAVQQDR